MGHIKRIRRKYATPRHPWNRKRIEEDRVLVDGYGLMNKKEILRVESVLRRFKVQAKKLLAQPGGQSDIESKQLRDRLVRLGLSGSEINLAEVLDLSVKHILERRLQTQVVRKNLARTMPQSRQFITHGHIFVNGRKINVPGHLLTVLEEESIVFNPTSSLSSNDHPERIQPEVVKAVDEVKEEIKSEEKDNPNAEGMP